MADQSRLRCVFMRGGTSKALMFHRRDLPENQDDWGPIFLAAMGTPDPNGRQLDGMGGGASSLSKVCVIGPPSRADADVDYTFVQLGVKADDVDYAGNCGNMSSAIGPFSVDEGLVKGPKDGETHVRIHNTNTNKIIVAHFRMNDGQAAVKGDFALDGVAGTGAPVRLDFLDPGGSKTGRLLPTGNAVDTLRLSKGEIKATLVDAANPCVFVDAADLGMTGVETPDKIDADTDLMARLEDIRRAASVAMGVTKDLDHAGRTGSVPKIGFVSSPTDVVTLSGRKMAAKEMNIQVRMLSMAQPHKAVPLTAALCLAAACSAPGSIPSRLMNVGAEGTKSIDIAHPSGVIRVGAQVEQRGNEVGIAFASVYRTTRRLFEGNVLYRNP